MTVNFLPSSTASDKIMFIVCCDPSCWKLRWANFGYKKLPFCIFSSACRYGARSVQKFQLQMSCLLTTPAPFFKDTVCSSIEVWPPDIFLMSCIYQPTCHQSVTTHLTHHITTQMVAFSVNTHRNEVFHKQHWIVFFLIKSREQHADNKANFLVLYLKVIQINTSGKWN